MLNIDFFNVINQIDDLFSNLEYKKREETQNSLKMIFLNREDHDCKYTVEIYNNNSVKVTIPINTEYLYTTYFDNILNVTDYLSLHLDKNKRQHKSQIQTQIQNPKIPILNNNIII